jgi:signal transduction histidine kinase
MKKGPIFKSFLEAGVESAADADEKGKIRILNQTAFIMAVALAAFIIINFFNQKPIISILEIAFLVLLIGIIYLNQIGRFHIGRAIFFISFIIFQFTLANFLAVKGNLEFFFLFIMIAGFALFDNRIIIGLLSVFCFSLFSFTQTHIHGFTSVIKYLNDFSLFLLVYFLVRYFKLVLVSQRTQIEQQVKELQLLHEEKNNLLSIASHELRSPLGHIKGLLSLIELEKGNLSESQKESLQMARDIASKQHEMVSKVLDIQNLESKQSVHGLEEIKVEDFLRGILQNFESTASAKDIRLDLMTPGQGLIFRTDTLKFSQILENILSNAIKFSHPGSHVEIWMSHTAHTLTIEVKDEGQGLSKEEIKDLFKKFKTLSARPTSGEASTGLGLAITKKYVEELKGTIHCTSEQGKGSTFSVHLPLTT